MGCLLVVMVAAFPRFTLLILWLARPNLVDAVFGTWIVPLIGLLLLPFATLMYILLYVPGVGVTAGGWVWVALGALIDVAHWVSGGLRQQRVTTAWRAY
ncbi:hypothetical protein GCM10022419_115330 [Nonomuraea rosea]|uniref:Uncharacterized protein n=1 Tax=Nonomuraea rosea TaxID=638574 RepID=A0ABP6ZIX4_9ACTN